MHTPTVLIVESDPIVRDFLKTRLAKAGYDVTLADPEDEVSVSKYDCVLADLPMPLSLDRVLGALPRLGLKGKGRHGRAA